MKTVKDKQILMGADFAGYPLKEAIKEYLEKKGWTVTDIGVKQDSDPNDTELMFHRIGLRVGAMGHGREVGGVGFEHYAVEGYGLGKGQR